MTEPASKEDLEKAQGAIIRRVDKLEEKLGEKMEGDRVQQSHELGSLFTLGQNILAGINWLKASWRRFGILPSPPDDKRPKGGS